MDESHKKAQATRQRLEAERLRAQKQKNAFIAGEQRILGDPESTRAERLEAARLVVELDCVHF